MVIVIHPKNFKKTEDFIKKELRENQTYNANESLFYQMLSNHQIRMAKGF